MPLRSCQPLVLISLCLAALVLLWIATPLRPPPIKQDDAPPVLSVPKSIKRRIVAVGDLHGDLEHALRVLRMAEVVDHRGNWIASKNTVLVQTGDIVDRGTDTIALYHLFQTLSEAAEKLKTQVVHLLGNHEMMNALGDWRYVTPQDIATFGGERNRRAAMSAEGWIGQMWLQNYSVSARVPYLKLRRARAVLPTGKGQQQVLTSPTLESESNGLLDAAAAFVHGGIHPDWALRDPKDPIGNINRIGRSLLYRAVAGPIRGSVSLPSGTTREEADLYSEGGPLWYRGYALDIDEDEVCERAREAMKALGVRLLVMGHTPHFEGIRSRCNGTVVLIDTGISRAYGGVLSALEIHYALSPRPLATPDEPTRWWIEKETVVALEEGNAKRILAKRETPVELAVAAYG